MNGQTPWHELFPEMSKEFQMPFWYSSLQSFWLYFPADPRVVASLLPELPAGRGVRVARFEDLWDQCLVSLDFQVYTSGWSSGLETTREIEFNAYVYPEAREPWVPKMPWQEYVRGTDQTKTIGGFRLHVPCDNKVAIKAGIALFGEPKFLASFVYTVPSPNSPEVTTWSYGVYDPLPDPPPPEPPADKLIFQVEADLQGLPTVTGNSTPLVEYGVVGPDSRRLVGNIWNFFGPFDTYFFNEHSAERVKLRLGSFYDRHRLREDIDLVIGTTPPVAAQIFTSAPVSSEDRAFYEVPEL
jgi:Vacuolar protein sorting-associated protein